MMIPTIGIVGGIGSGKSLAAQALHRLGGYLIAADQLGHEALRQPDIKAKLVQRFGAAILDADGDADRKKIGRIVFADPAALRDLEAIVFPYIEKRIREEIAQARGRAGVQYIILDAAILFEAGWESACEKVIFVDAPRELRLVRLQQERDWDETELNRREKVQMPLEEKRSRADAVVVNDGCPDKVSRQVEELLVLWKYFC